MTNVTVNDELFVCPECGLSMMGIDPMGHSLVHYPDYLDPAKSSKEARANQKLIQGGGVVLSVYLDKLEKVG